MFLARITGSLVSTHKVESMVGQKLLVPGARRGRASPARYTVKAGDTLWHIAKRHDVTVAELRVWNKLGSNNLRVGQQLRVLKPGAKRVKVKPGDTLWEIAKRHGTTVAALARRNAINPKHPLKVGAVLAVAGL